MAVKKTQMYRRNLDGTETNLNPLTESQYVLMENGQTVQEVLSDRDSDKYTPVITNSSSTFKVGQGDNVDLSSSMKEGAYDSCVLKGKTMVNCIQEPSSKDVVLPYEFEDGQYVTINDTKESGALGVELKGQTLVNLDKNTYPITNWGTNENSNNYFRDNTTLAGGMFKPATKYLFKIYGLSCNYDMVQLQGISGQFSQVWSTGFVFNKNGSLVLQSSDSIQTFTSYIPHFRRNDIKNLTEQDKQNFKMIILEYQEGMENWDIPYFTGMTSCKMPTLHTVGKNLCDTCKYIHGGLSSNNMIFSKDQYRSYYMKCKPSTTYVISVENSNNRFGVGSSHTFSEDTTFPVNTYWITSSNDVTGQTLQYTVTTTEKDKYLYVYVANNGVFNPDIRVQVEEATSPTSYESYKSSILSLPEEVVLRSLPNGVCDTFNTRTGVYTRYIEEVVLNGADPITSLMTSVSDVNTTTSRCYLDYGNIPDNIAMKRYSSANTASDKIICDLLPTLSVLPDIQTTDIESIGQTTAGFSIRVRGKSITECKQRLAERPVTILYERQVPIVTKINLSSTLKSWNTTTHIHSEIPENTLYPVLSHSNPTYPVILKPSTKYSIVANSYSNNHTNSAINFNLGGATASTTVGNRVTTITTPSTLSNELLTMRGRGNKLNNVMVIEGDVVGDEPYFEGICDCKSPILRNTGLTLYESPFEKVYGEDATREFFNMMDLAPYVDKWGANKNYTFSFDIKANKSGTAQIYFQNGTGSRHNFVFRVPVTAEYVRHTVTTNISGTDHNWKESRFACFTTYNTGCFATIKNIQFALGTSVEPYKSNTTTFDQKDDKTIVLRSLPNGVCDTLNVETGEHVQRIGEIVLNGNNDITLSISGSSNNYPNITRVWLRSGELNNLKENVGGNIICNKLPNIGANGDYEKISVSNGIDIHIATSKLSEETPNAVKQYLLQNPIEIQYELATPIVTTIDVQGFPYAYTNGHVQLSSGSIEQSLTPTVEYSLSANKTGQINSNTKRVSAHQKQLDDFEAMMLTQMVQSAYDKAILQFDYEMQMMSLGGE